MKFDKKFIKFITGYHIKTLNLVKAVTVMSLASTV